MVEEQNRLTPLGVSFNSFQAHIIKTKLNACDIPCFLFDIESFNAMSHLSLAIGGVRIMVLKDDLVEATAILSNCTDELSLK